MLLSFSCPLSCFQYLYRNHSSNALMLPRPIMLSWVGTVFATLKLMRSNGFLLFVPRLVQSWSWRRRNYPGGKAAHIFFRNACPRLKRSRPALLRFPQSTLARISSVRLFISCATLAFRTLYELETVRWTSKMIVYKNRFSCQQRR
jgi:hypothetical protein